MLPHMLDHIMNILEEAHVTELIHLIMADRLIAELSLNILQIVGARGDRGDAGAREGDLRGGGELIDEVRIPRPLALREDLDQVILLLVIEVMHAVGIVPVNPEILCRGLQPRESPDRLVAVAVALGVGILRHTPDPLDALILSDQSLDKSHIRAARRHRDRNHLDSEVLRDAEVPVIARDRAEPLHLIQPAPGDIPHHTVRHGTGNGVIHHIQGGVSVDDDVVRIVLHHIGNQDLGLCDPVQHSVISAVRPVLTEHVRIAVQRVHKSHGEVELLLAGLSAAHVEAHLHRLISSVFLFQFADQLLKLFHAHLFVSFHPASSASLILLLPPSLI